MTNILNTTNLRESILREILKVVIPPDTIPVVSISLRNKAKDTMHGNWGMFYPDSYRITLTVPQDIIEYPCYTAHRHHHVSLSNRYEFAAAIIGHEYRHAWQWCNKRKEWEELGKRWRECDAEDWEIDSLIRWREYVEENKIEIPIDEAESQSVAKTVRYGDYRK